MGAERFITSNKRVFGADIEEIDVTYPGDLRLEGGDVGLLGADGLGGGAQAG